MFYKQTGKAEYKKIRDLSTSLSGEKKKKEGNKTFVPQYTERELHFSL